MTDKVLEELKIDLKDELLTVDEVAKFIHCNKTKVYELINSGVLPCLRLGRIKVLKSTLIGVLKKYEGCDLSNPNEIVYLDKGR